MVGWQRHTFMLAINKHSHRNKSLVHAKMQRHLFCYICNVIFVFVVVAIKMRFWCCGTTADHPNPNGLEISNYQIVQHQWDSKLETSKITNILPSVATNRSQKRAYQKKYKRSSIIDGPIVELKLSYANVYLISVYSRGDAQYQMSNFFFLMILSRLFPPLTVCTGFAAAAAAFFIDLEYQSADFLWIKFRLTFSLHSQSAASFYHFFLHYSYRQWWLWFNGLKYR